jgi:hypothetical protein
MAYFSNFPSIVYNGVTCRNIILKSAILSEVFNKKSVFYRYIIKEGMRPDMVAHDVYGDPTYDWVVYFSNYVVDPYYDWPLDTNDFNGFIEKKYGQTIYQLQNTTSHYRYTGQANDTQADKDRKNWKMSANTYSNLSADEIAGWTPISVYDYENELNDAKRSIQLLSVNYLSQIENELAEIFSK